MEKPSVRNEIKDIILRALNFRYTSESCKDRIPTGNKYQSLILGDQSVEGFRSDRRSILQKIEFTGKRVLDLGSNLGELSRTARELGADIVDGYEYDEFFIEVANLVNVLNGITRVSFFRRDITDASSYPEEYDIILAFSVFTYIQPIMATVASRTRQLLVLETHALNNNLDLYLNCITPYLGVYQFIDRTDWGRNLDEKTDRVVLAFARDRETLERLVCMER